MRKVLLLLFVLAVSIAAVAQAPSTPQAKPATPAANAPTQPPPKLSVAQIMDRSLTNVENDLVPLVEAMPDDKFTFAPSQGEFKGVRNFGTQAKHIAHTNFQIFAALLGEKPPANVDPKEDDGPPSMTAKADIVKYVKDSFAMGHRAMATLTEANLTERITPNPFGGNGPGPTKLGAANLTLWHSFDHYGQMVEYLRMNNIIPPASRK
jgi:uncharacterized damage-inducible protein DinB